MSGTLRAWSSARRVLAILALAAATAATAQEGTAQDKYASPRVGSFQLSIFGYRPKIDSEFGGAATPFATIFGNGRGVLGRVDIAYSLLIREEGTLDLGVGGGYYQTTGHGLLPDGTRSGDLTKFKTVPTRLSLTYRLDLLWERYTIPLAPFVRVSFDRYWWWVTNGSGSTANAGGLNGSGATNGYSFSGGIALLLDFIDRQLAREMDRNSGVNHTYAFFEIAKSTINDFGSSTSWDLSDAGTTIGGGLLFVF